MSKAGTVPPAARALPSAQARMPQRGWEGAAQGRGGAARAAAARTEPSRAGPGQATAGALRDCRRTRFPSPRVSQRKGELGAVPRLLTGRRGRQPGRESGGALRMRLSRCLTWGEGPGAPPALRMRAGSRGRAWLGGG